MSGGIMFRKEITAIGNALGLKGEFAGEFGFDQIMAILAPEPEMETVEFKRYAAISPNGDYADGCDYERPLVEIFKDKIGYQVIPLTGTYQRAKKQPVERSVSVECHVDKTGTPRIGGGFPALCGEPAENKTGVLTFTWQEEQ